MKILVFDDSQAHRMAAELSLKGHDLTVVGTYDEAQDALLPRLDENKATNEILPGLLEKAGLVSDFNPCYQKGKETSEKDNEKYYAKYREAGEKAATYPDFDVVLTDLMVPASRQALGRGKHLAGQEMPLGTTIALLALTAGIKNVAVVTDMDHHSHPASAAFDCFGRFSGGKNSNINIICTNHVQMLNIDESTGQIVDAKFLESEKGKEMHPNNIPGRPWYERKGIIQGKNWGSVLKMLLGEKDD